MSKNVNDTFCLEHCICLEMPLSEKKSEMLDKYLRKYTETNKEKMEKIRIEATSRFSLSQSMTGKRNWRLTISLDSISDEGINEKDFRKVFPFLQDALANMDKYKIKEYDSTSCSSFIFHSDHYSIVGGLILPTEIDLSQEMIEKLGKTEISGINLNFRESPLGLDKLEISLEEKGFKIRLSIDSKLTTIEKYVEDSYDLANHVSKLFVERKK